MQAANIGDGPGWWVVVFAAGLATAALFAAWLVLAQIGHGVDAVTIDRDLAAGVRLGAFLAACGAGAGPRRRGGLGVGGADGRRSRRRRCRR